MQPKRAVGLLVLGLCSIGILWLLWRGAPADLDPLAPDARAARRPGTTNSSVDQAGLAAAPARVARDSARETSSEPEQPSESKQAAGPRAEPDAAAPTYPLRLAFVLPDRSAAALEGVQVQLRAQSGERHSFTRSGPLEELHARIGFGIYRLSVEAPNLRHFDETLDLSSEAEFENRDPEQGFFRRVTLWPSGWLPVIVRTRDGRPFEAITSELGYEPKRLFVDAFQLHASLERFEPGQALPPEPGKGEGGEFELAHFQPPVGWQNVRIGDDMIGSLQVLAPPPFWVGLWLHGTLFESRLLQPTDRELRFEIDLADIDERLARVRLRLVDRDSGERVREGARATLKANTSAHRRHDLQERAPDENGAIDFVRVIPGAHELSIQRGSNLVQRQLQLAPGEELDLGELPIGLDAPIELHVLDAEGRPCPSTLEITHYRRGAAVGELYHPNLHTTTDEKGRYSLPVPDQLSILRARPLFPYGEAARRTDVIGTRNLLLDPEELPRELILTVRAPVELSFTARTPWREGDRTTIEDEELQLVIETLERLGKKLRVVPGRYLVRRWDAQGHELGSQVVFVESTPLSLELP